MTFSKVSGENVSNRGGSSAQPSPARIHTTVSILIIMEDRSATPWRSITARDRRYSVPFPFAADAEMLDMQTGAKARGVTSDLSIGGTFVCCTKSFLVGSRIRLVLTRKEQVLESLAVVRISKPRIGMGIEFLDMVAPFDQILFRWIEQLRKK
jgi:hypothetical protein